MHDYRTEASFGARVRALRNLRGLNTAELAAVINDGKTTESVLENIEAGRKVTADVSMVLNLAMALDVPVSYLLAPMSTPDAGLDLSNLSQRFEGMTVGQFDAWLTRPERGAYHSPTHHDLNAEIELQVLRNWIAQRLETARLEAILTVETENNIKQDVGPFKPTAERLRDSQREELRLKQFLLSAGWPLESEDLDNHA